MGHSHHRYVFHVCWKVLRARQIPILIRFLCEMTKLFENNIKRELQTVQMCCEERLICISVSLAYKAHSNNLPPSRIFKLNVK